MYKPKPPTGPKPPRLIAERLGMTVEEYRLAMAAEVSRTSAINAGVREAAQVAEVAEAAERKRQIERNAQLARALASSNSADNALPRPSGVVTRSMARAPLSAFNQEFLDPAGGPGFGYSVPGATGATAGPLTKLNSECFKIEELSSTRPVRVAATLSQGDCLFSSIYRACTAQKLLPTLATLEVRVDTEANFIVDFRNRIADTVDLHPLYDRVLYLYTSLRKSRKTQEDIDNEVELRRWMQDPAGLDPWQKAIIQKYICIPSPDFNAFELAYKTGIETRTNYASDIEFFQAKDLLENRGIIMKSLNSKCNRLPQIPGRIYVFNAGNRGGGAHYQYFSYTVAGGRKTRKARKANKRKSIRYRR